MPRKKYKRIYPNVCGACGYRVYGEAPISCPQCGHLGLVPEARRWGPKVQAPSDVPGDCFECGKPAEWHPEVDGRLMIGAFCRGPPEQPLELLHLQEAIEALSGIQRFAAPSSL